MQIEPSLRNRQIKACLVLGRRALQFKDKGAVDFLNVDPAILYRLDRIGDLDQFRAAASGSA
jgi:hypothetical protein